MAEDLLRALKATRRNVVDHSSAKAKKIVGLQKRSKEPQMSIVNLRKRKTTAQTTIATIAQARAADATGSNNQPQLPPKQTLKSQKRHAQKAKEAKRARQKPIASPIYPFATRQILQYYHNNNFTS